jgi:hypothetical protein
MERFLRCRGVKEIYFNILISKGVEVMDIIVIDYLSKINFGEVQSFKNLQIIPYNLF